MDIRLYQDVEVELQGRTVAVAVQLSVDHGPDINLQELLHAVGEKLMIHPGAKPAAIRAPESQAKEAPKAANEWEAPDLHGKAMKSVHRVVDAIARAGGKGLTVPEIVSKARISTVPAYRMLKPDHPQGEYAAKFLRVTKVGRNQVVDVTPEGQHLASLIRAGKVPV